MSHQLNRINKQNQYHLVSSTKDDTPIQVSINRSSTRKFPDKQSVTSCTNLELFMGFPLISGSFLMNSEFFSFCFDSKNKCSLHR